MCVYFWFLTLACLFIYSLLLQDAGVPASWAVGERGRGGTATDGSDILHEGPPGYLQRGLRCHDPPQVSIVRLPSAPVQV